LGGFGKPLKDKKTILKYYKELILMQMNMEDRYFGLAQLYNS
jgi:hypothetical protein